MTGPAPIDFTDRVAVVARMGRRPGRLYAFERACRTVPDEEYLERSGFLNATARLGVTP